MRLLANEPSLMHLEAAEAAAMVRRQISQHSVALQKVGERLRGSHFPFIVTCARGSSDHAALYGKYLFETQQRIVVASFAPSVGSIYGSCPNIGKGLCIAISQSGQSPDLLAVVNEAKRQGSLTLAIVNDEASPLAKIADILLPICAGVERSVAATKSYIGSLSLLIALSAHWSGDEGLLTAWQSLPELIERSWELDWTPLSDHLQTALGLYVIGRGPGLGIASEAALKFKETCGLHAEAFSSAEVRHGPMALVNRDFPLLLFRQDDQSASGLEELATAMMKRGAPLFAARGIQSSGSGTTLPALEAHPLIQPILQIQSFYRMVDALALRRGFDPDNPPLLNKVTETI
ncbi:MAG: SIS domain-containing protein [Sphingorhabdus sp.]